MRFCTTVNLLRHNQGDCDSNGECKVQKNCDDGNNNEFCAWGGVRKINVGYDIFMP